MSFFVKNGAVSLKNLAEVNSFKALPFFFALSDEKLW
jgi:hypothetical protein